MQWMHCGCCALRGWDEWSSSRDGGEEWRTQGDGGQWATVTQLHLYECGVPSSYLGRTLESPFQSVRTGGACFPSYVIPPPPSAPSLPHHSILVTLCIQENYAHGSHRVHRGQRRTPQSCCSHSSDSTRVLHVQFLGRVVEYSTASMLGCMPFSDHQIGRRGLG